DALQSLYKAAKAEGQVILWSPLDPPEVRMLVEAFNKEFPGIEVNHFEIRPSDFASRVVAEAQQGRISFDVGTGRLAAISPLIQRGLIESHQDWTKIFTALKPAAVSDEGRLLTIYSLFYPIAYHTKLIRPTDVPTSWKDLLDSKWKNKIIVEPRANAFAYLGLKWGEEAMVDYLKKLRVQDPIFVKGGSGVVQQLIAGVAPLAVGGNVHNILQRKDEGAPVGWASKASPIGATDNVMFTMKGAKHPNAAKLFTGWLASDRAQDVMATKLFRAAAVPGSSYVVMKELEKNRVEIVRETPENYQKVRALDKSAVKALGVLK
ncbi:MAG TPA: extracellular solute-binding protein, partial [Candidatus Eisenbacteria bacterium]|nr:extracellular solute-binding protein [Candidatus Eisenbacteria bacterium]